MFKYMKWELREELKNKRIILLFIAIVYFLIYALPSKNFLYNYICIPYGFILLGSLFLSFVYGTKRTLDSYKNQTFLLESMIPISPGKLLLAKYILAILANIFYVIIFIIGMCIMLAKVDISTIKEIIELLFSLKIDEIAILMRIFIVLLSTTIACTSIITLIYLMLKSFFPNARGLRIISFIIGGIVLDIISNVLFSKAEYLDKINYEDIVYSLIFIAISVICYFISVWFVKEKLEVYN